MNSHEEFEGLYELETWRLAQIVLEESEAFAEARDQIVRRYGQEALRPNFMAFVAPSRAREVIRALHVGVENRVRDFNDKLYELICVRLRWCQRRGHPLVQDIDILAAIVDIFYTRGAAALTVLLLKRKFLDRLCNCKVGE